MDRWQRIKSTAKSPRARRAARTGLQLAVVGGCIAIGRTLEWHELYANAGRVSGWHLLLGGACAFVNLFGKGTSWWFLLGRPPRLPLLSLWAVHLRCAAGNIVLPLRAGEGLRVLWLSRLLERPAAAIVRVALYEKVLNLLALALLAAPATLALPSVPPRLQQGLYALLGIAAVGGGGLWGARCWSMARARGRPKKAHGTGAAALAALGRAVRAPEGFDVREAACAVLTSLLGWAADATLVFSMANGVGAELPLWQAPLLLVAVNVAIALPSTPAHVGTMELAATSALMMLGASKPAAASFALLYHAVQVVPVLAVAGAVEGLQRYGRRQRAPAA